ncbi:hypothetical protein YPPY36_1529, partial [Yersinia pestis PY-36]
MQRLS